MWTSLVNLGKNAASFLSSSKFPPGTPFELQDSLRKENHLKSKKFFIVVTAFFGLLFFYFTSVGILFIIPADNREIVEGYVVIFTKTIEVLAIIIAAYLGVQAAVDLRYSSSSNKSYETIKSIEQIDEKIITEETIKYAEIYKDDPSYAPVEWALNHNN